MLGLSTDSYTPAALSREVSSVIAQHLHDLRPFMNSTNGVTNLNAIVSMFEQLVTLIDCPPENATPEQLTQVEYLRFELEGFLHHMNQQIDTDFEETMQIGQIVRDAARWGQQVRAILKPSISHIWKLLEPAVPDRIVDLGNGLYEARWWKPVPVMDVEIVRRTDGIRVETAPFEPAGLSGGIALRFRLVNPVL